MPCLDGKSASSSIMINRRTFFVKASALASLALAGPMASIISHNGDVARPDDDELEIDLNASYVAVAMEADGTLLLSEILHNRKVQGDVFAPEKTGDIMSFVNQSGLGRIVFVDWAAAVDNDIPVSEITFTHVDGELPTDLVTRFMESALALKLPIAEG